MISVRRILLPAFLVGLLAVLILHVRPFSPQEPFRLELRMSAVSETKINVNTGNAAERPEEPLPAKTGGRARLYFDRGNGFVAYDSLGIVVSPGSQTLRFPLPDSTISAVRFWPLDRMGKATIESATIIDPDGKSIRSLLEPAETPVEMETKPGVGCDFLLDSPLELRRTWTPKPIAMATDFAIAAAATALLLALGALLPPRFRLRCVEILTSTRRALERVPRLVLFFAAVAATVASCYPIIFAGRSFVSPGNGALLLYDEAPTIPGAPLPPAEDPRGSDVGALMWAHVPYSAIEHRAIFRDHEWPLWNRNNYCGVPLLGQGMSMLGDPLHWLPITQDAAAWAWDLKFLLAKTLFALGIGLCVRAATGRLWLAALLALSSSFLGFFSYRFNHPAFFAICYAPWILHAWLRASLAPGRVWPWAIAVALANFWQFNTGVMKESTMLIVGLNFTGLLLVLSAAEGRWRKFGAMLWGCGLFVLLSAPCWLTFLDALRHSWTPYDTPRAFQIPPNLALGLFDDIFYRQFTTWENHYNPSANFLIFLGCAWALAHLRTLLADRTFTALAAGALVPAVLAFGIVPASVITKIPFLANIDHVDNTFSVVLIVHLMVLSAFGLRALWESARAPKMGADWLLASLVLGTFFALYFGIAQAIPRDLPASALTFSPSIFFTACGGALALSVLVLPWLVRALRQSPSFGAFLLCATALFIIHFRHGMWTETKFDYYVMNPKLRAELAAPSPGLESVRASIAARHEPFRIAGYKLALVPGFQAIYDFEHFAGADALVGRQQRELAERIGTPPLWGWRWQFAEGGWSKHIFSLCNLWGIRWLVGMPSDTPGAPPTGDLTLKENPNAWPRAFFSNLLVDCNSVDNFVELLWQSGPFAATTPLRPEDRPAAVMPPGTVSTSRAATDYILTSNTTTFSLEAPVPGTAVLTETYEPGNWRVTLDGKPTDYFRVNHAFLGVKIDAPGKHTLRFEYWPKIFTLALYLAAGGGGLLLLTPLLACFCAPKRPD